MSETTKKYNLSVCPLMESRSGNLSWNITQEVFDNLQNIEIGGRILIKFLRDDQRKNGDRSPKAYFEYMSKEDVEAFKTQTATQQATSL